MYYFHIFLTNEFIYEKSFKFIHISCDIHKYVFIYVHLFINHIDSHIAISVIIANITCIFNRQQGATWIVKPAAKSQGRGIFLFRKLKDLVEWKSKELKLQQPGTTAETYIVQRYVDNPYLVAGLFTTFEKCLQLLKSVIQK